MAHSRLYRVYYDIPQQVPGVSTKSDIKIFCSLPEAKEEYTKRLNLLKKTLSEDDDNTGLILEDLRKDDRLMEAWVYGTAIEEY